MVNYNPGYLPVLGVFAALLRRRRPFAEQDAAHAACSVYLLMFWREGGARTVSEKRCRRRLRPEVSTLRNALCEGEGNSHNEFCSGVMSSLAMSQIHP